MHLQREGPSRLFSYLLLALLLASASASSSSPPEIFAKIQERWVFHEDYPEGCKDKWVEYTPVESGRRIQATTAEPDRNGETTFYYEVVESDTTSITMILENEKRTNEKGEPIVWILELVSGDTFVWRMAHWPRDASYKQPQIWDYRRIRCESEDA